jgi:hypothetical protein
MFSSVSWLGLAHAGRRRVAGDALAPDRLTQGWRSFMRNKSWLRYGLASLTMLSVGLGAFVVACSDDAKQNTAMATDGGGDATAKLPETGPTPPNDSGPVDNRPKAKIHLVNAATSFGPNNTVGALRVCFEIGAPGDSKKTVAPLPPLPDTNGSSALPYPGVFIGTGGPVTTTGLDLAPLELTPYLMNAGRLAARGIVRSDAGTPPTCDELIAVGFDGGALVEGTDYWKMPAIPAGTFAREKSVVLVLTGCAGDVTIPADLRTAKCGPDFTSSGVLGNLKITPYDIDRTTPIGADKFGAQFIHASPQAASALAVSGVPVVPGFVTDGDAGTFRGITADGGAVALGEKTPLVQVANVNPMIDSFTANPAVAGLAIPLTQGPVNIQLLTYGASVPDGGAYRNGAAFTFIALGDPEIGPEGKTKAFHYIGLPNEFENPLFK